MTLYMMTKNLLMFRSTIWSISKSRTKFSTEGWEKVIQKCYKSEYWMLEKRCRPDQRGVDISKISISWMAGCCSSTNSSSVPVSCFKCQGYYMRKYRI